MTTCSRHEPNYGTFKLASRAAPLECTVDVELDTVLVTTEDGMLTRWTCPLDLPRLKETLTVPHTALLRGPALRLHVGDGDGGYNDCGYLNFRLLAELTPCEE